MGRIKCLICRPGNTWRRRQRWRARSVCGRCRASSWWSPRCRPRGRRSRPSWAAAPSWSCRSPRSRGCARRGRSPFQTPRPVQLPWTRGVFITKIIEWFLEDQAFSPSYDLGPPPPLFPPSVSSTGDTLEDWERETTWWGDRGEGGGEKACVIYKSFNTLWFLCILTTKTFQRKEFGYKEYKNNR